jgi:transposase
MGVDEIYFGKQMKFLTAVSNWESGEPLWFGQDRKQEMLDEFFRTQLTESQRRIEAACVDMWRPFLPTASNHGLGIAGSCMTSSTFCNTPIRPSMKCAERSSSARVGACGVW